MAVAGRNRWPLTFKSITFAGERDYTCGRCPDFEPRPWDPPVVPVASTPGLPNPLSWRTRSEADPQRAWEGALSALLLAQLEGFPDASMDVILDVRERIAASRHRFRAAIAKTADELATALVRRAGMLLRSSRMSAPRSRSCARRHPCGTPHARCAENALTCRLRLRHARPQPRLRRWPQAPPVACPLIQAAAVGPLAAAAAKEMDYRSPGEEASFVCGPTGAAGGLRAATSAVGQGVHFGLAEASPVRPPHSSMPASAFQAPPCTQGPRVRDRQTTISCSITPILSINRSASAAVKSVDIERQPSLHSAGDL